MLTKCNSVAPFFHLISFRGQNLVQGEEAYYQPLVRDREVKSSQCGIDSINKEVRAQPNFTKQLAEQKEIVNGKTISVVTKTIS